MSGARRYRNLCFTVFNYDAALEVTLQSLPCKYLVYGREICPDTKRLHLQGYIEFLDAKTISSFQKGVGNNAHCESRKGKPSEAAEYCKKDADYFETGKISRQGKRNDLSMIRNLVEDGANMREIIDASANYQCLRMAEKVLTYNEKQRDFPPSVLWYWGPTGTGKTRAAYADSVDPYTANLTGQWWDGYDAHQHVIIDDFRGDFCKFRELLRILDRYSCRLPYKGGFRQLLATQIIITCPFHPEYAYPGISENMDQLLRRIKTIVFFPPKLVLPDEICFIEQFPQTPHQDASVYPTKAHQCQSPSGKECQEVRPFSDLQIE